VYASSATANLESIFEPSNGTAFATPGIAADVFG